MNERKETSEEKRERLRQAELKKTTGALSDGINRGENGNLADLVGDLGWKGLGILIIAVIVGYVLFKVFF